jgi:hypothetical protein
VLEKGVKKKRRHSEAADSPLKKVILRGPGLKQRFITTVGLAG